MSKEPTQPHAGDGASLGDVLAELHNINARLQNLEHKFDARSRETQPMSERINQIVSELAATRHEVRHENWLRAFRASAEFFDKHLKGRG